MSGLDDFVDGMAPWQEHKPQSGEDWLAVAVRCLEMPPRPENPSPLFAGLLLAVEALIECARQSGADVTDGAPTWPPVNEWAVRCVRELREDYDAA